MALLSLAAQAEGLSDCRAIAEAQERLACYDALSGTPGAPVKPQSDPIAPSAYDTRNLTGSLSQRWELAEADKQGTFLFRPHRPVYVLPLRGMSNPDQSPTSPNGNNQVTQAFDLDRIEAKFQISFKTKAWQNIFGSPVDFWFAYTQQSYWQVYNKAGSSPFRETNYEPEAFFTVPVGLSLGSAKLQMLNFGMVHQSNGRTTPLSRSWNRLYMQAGIEAGDFSFLVRPWYRLRESESTDDNADISDYVGRGDLVAIFKKSDNLVTATARHSLRGGDHSHGSLELDWSFPISNYLRGYLQVFTGYGESLIDYNHKQTTIGVGVSLAEWL